jgi:hypothetical protein
MDINPLIIPILGVSCGLLAVFGGVFVLPFFKLKQRQLELSAQKVAEKAAQYASKQGILEERVAVLERIITDQGYSLAKEIEELRSLPPKSVTPQKELI